MLPLPRVYFTPVAGRGGGTKGGRMVRELITKLGGPSAVAKRLCISRQAIYHWIELDKIPETSAFKIAHVYGLTLDEVGLEQYSRS